MEAYGATAVLAPPQHGFKPLLLLPLHATSARTWGVWISQRRERSMVWSTNWPSALSLTVAFIGTASTAAPCSSASLITCGVSMVVQI